MVLTNVIGDLQSDVPVIDGMTAKQVIMDHNSKLYEISKCIEINEGFRTSVKQSFLIAIKFKAMS